MFDGTYNVGVSVEDALRRLGWRWQLRLARLRRGLAYLFGALDADAAQQIMLDCRASSGWYPLLILTVDETLKQALEDFVDHPELRRLIADGCARVESKWECYGDELFEARRWAIDVAEGYAIDEGIRLQRRDA